MVNLTLVSSIVLVSFGFFLLTLFSAINHFRISIKNSRDDSLSSPTSNLFEINEGDCLINSTTGLIQGHALVINGARICEYLGIPYAQAPVGKLRFKHPVPMKRWNKTWLADEWPANCVQTFPSWAKFMMRPVINEINEDCLYINIWSPHTAEDQDTGLGMNPILFWIHGGGFQFGSGTLQETNGSVLSASTSSVVVTINYRLNAFGFLNLNSFNPDSGSWNEHSFDIQGNQGLYDQSLALDWVRSNAIHFNGDTDLITLWGQGMGGISTSIHLISPLMRNKFKRAIIQTGTMFTSRQMYSRSEMVGEEFVNLLNCAQGEGDYESGGGEEGNSGANYVIECLQRKSFEEIRFAVEEINSKNPISFLFSPFEKFLNFSSPSEIKTDLKKFINPNLSDIIFGFNSDEGSLLLNSLLPEQFPTKSEPKVSSIEEAKEILTNLFVNRLNVPKSVINVGLNSAFTNAKTSSGKDEQSQEIVKSMIDFVGNNIFICPTILAAQEISSQINQQVSVHLYTYTSRSSYNKLPSWFGAIHNEEVPVMFGHPVRFPDEYTSNERSLSLKLMQMIGDFAKTG